MYKTLYNSEFRETFKHGTKKLKLIKSFYFQLNKGQTVEEQFIYCCGWLTCVSDLFFMKKGQVFR